MLEHSLIPADHVWGLLAVVLGLAAFGLWAEKTRWGARLSGCVIAILGGMLLSNLSVIPAAAGLYDMVWSYIVPLAIPMLLLNADLKLIIKESGPTLIAFLIGGVGTVVGTVVAFYLIPLGEEGWKLAGIFCSTYIGGSINYVASAEALQMKTGELLAAGIAADNLVMTLYFLLLFALPSIKFLRKQFVSRHEHAPQATASAGEAAQKQAPQMDLLSMALTLALSAVLCAAGYGLAALIGIKSTGILFVTALSVIVATLFPKKASSLGGDQMGMLLMQIFFVVIGATANIIIVFKVGPILFVFAALILLIHLFFILVGGKLFKLDLVEIVLASNANMGGPTTAAAMAVARKWDSLVIPAILCGTLGYAIATFIGVAVGNLLK